VTARQARGAREPVTTPCPARLSSLFASQSSSRLSRVRQQNRDGKRQQQNSRRLGHACVGWERPCLRLHLRRGVASSCGFTAPRVVGAAGRKTRQRGAWPYASKRAILASRARRSLRINGAAELMAQASPMWPPVGFFVVTAEISGAEIGLGQLHLRSAQ
jgi:hypothetical protein